MPSSIVNAKQARRGFALLITVTLLAFLVLLVVSLASLTRVETAVAANSQSVAQARAHALMALNIALGQLQAQAGPDARITARAEAVLSGAGTGTVTNPNLTGVWMPAAGVDPATWLVSGSEVAGATAASILEAMPDPAVDGEDADTVFLIGNQMVAVDAATVSATEKARRIKVRKQDVFAADGVAAELGAITTPRIGRYAWWIGDEGVKASLALPDRADEVTYAPWDTVTQRRRIRQQIGSAPNYYRNLTAVTAAPLEGFDPLVTASLGKVAENSQMIYLAPAAGRMADFMRAHHHDFVAVAHGVLANTRTDAHGGLMRDLSLKPEALGAAFVNYSQYATYMETPGLTVAGADAAYPAILNADSSRRRYKIVAPTAAASADDLPDLVFGVAPVLSEFLLQFRFSFDTANVLTARVRLYIGLWNPYTAALAPSLADDLAIEIEGLPTVTVRNDDSGASTVLDLQAALPALIKGPNGALRAKIPFGNTASSTSNGTRADRSSWLPGRVYGWTTESGLTPTDTLRFYSKTLNVTGWAYNAVPSAGGGDTPLSVNTNGLPTPGLILRLTSANGTLATYTTPDFGAVDTASGATARWDFGFAARLNQPAVSDADRTWLKKTDPRAQEIPAAAFRGFDVNQDIVPIDPNVYAGLGNAPTAHPEFLLYRIQGASAASQSSYNDVPVFELPRMPHLSVGELQHLQLKTTRPFAIGNSWGGTANAVFDRYFFSGLPATTSATRGVPDLAAGQPLPNWNLRVIDASNVAALQAGSEHSSRHLLQAGAFNLNSTSVAAWRAMLSLVRFAHPFEAADIENASGDALGTQKTSTAVRFEPLAADVTLGVGDPAPAFFRFAQSAQETFFWGNVSASTNARQFRTHAFRLGVRGSINQSGATPAVPPAITAQRLGTDQIETLAAEIVRRLKIRAAVSGPFRTLEEFLGPGAGAGTDSLLEAAIASVGLNAAEIAPQDAVASVAGVFGAGFSSLTLTQADILTALAPYLRARSDTFVIRTYGETVNSATAEVAGKAWLEAMVQRFPETVDAADNIDQPAGAFGRRFKIISFRWLSSHDI